MDTTQPVRLAPVRHRGVFAAAVAAALAVPATVQANDSFGSEFSHVVAGAAVASAVTVVADHFGAENRGWIGFGTAVGLSFVAEAAQVVSDGSKQVKGSSLDFASNLIGAALGAWVTDQYILSPVATKDVAGHNRFGVTLAMKF